MEGGTPKLVFGEKALVAKVESLEAQLSNGESANMRVVQEVDVFRYRMGTVQIAAWDDLKKRCSTKIAAVASSSDAGTTDVDLGAILESQSSALASMVATVSGKKSETTKAKRIRAAAKEDKPSSKRYKKSR